MQKLPLGTDAITKDIRESLNEETCIVRKVNGDHFWALYQKRSSVYDFLGDYKSRDNPNMSRTLISRKELDYYLYERNEVSPVKLEQGSPEEEAIKQQIIAKKIPNYEGIQEPYEHLACSII